MLRMFKKHHFKSVIAALLSLVLSVSAFGGVGNVVWGDVQGVKSVYYTYVPFDEAYNGKALSLSPINGLVNNTLPGYQNCFHSLSVLYYCAETDEYNLFPKYTLLTLGPQGGDASCMHYNLLWHYIGVEPVIMRAVCEDCGAIYADIKFDGNLSDTQYAWADLPIEIESSVLPEQADFPTVKTSSLTQPDYTVEHIIPDDYDYSAQCSHNNIRKVYVGQTPAWQWWTLDVIKERVICSDCGLCDEYTWNMTTYKYTEATKTSLVWPALTIEEEDTPFIQTETVDEAHDVTIIDGFPSRQNWDQVKELIVSQIDPEWDDFSKAIWIYSWVATHYGYGDVEYSDDDQSGKWMAVNGYGLCAAYMYLYRLLCNEVGVECRNVVHPGCHGWNMIKIDGNWYGLDCTYGGYNAASADCGYFMKSDEALIKTTATLIQYSPAGDYVYATDTTYDCAKSSEVHYATYEGKLIDLTTMKIYENTSNTSVADRLEMLHEGNNSAGYKYATIPEEYQDADPWQYEDRYRVVYDGKIYAQNNTSIYEYDPVTKTDRVFLDLQDIANVYPEYFLSEEAHFFGMKIEGDYMIVRIYTGVNNKTDPRLHQFSIAMTEEAANVSSVNDATGTATENPSSDLNEGDTDLNESNEIEAVTKGDVNLDGNVDATDALCVLQAVVNLKTLTETQKINADMDGNGKTEANDALNILKCVVGLS